ncbi:MAG: tryptophan 2,3-dioxygenase family protein [Bacteroidetes bacterium]|nr:tryptophan 2,3-dioxygenase family protein [Bacteroidota bacterium]
MSTEEGWTKEQLVERIRAKYKGEGLNPDTFMTGLLWSKPISYWDYINLDALLSLQVPRTIFPDEHVFIMYHQINELIFKMILHEIEQVAEHEGLDVAFFKSRVGRIARYFDMLVSSFSIMQHGMDIDQYMRYRNSLAPASGFQSAQYRLIELCSTDIENLIDNRFRKDYSEDWSYEDCFDKIYWQAAGVDHKTGEKSYTLEDFESKYMDRFIETAARYEDRNLYALYHKLDEEASGDEELRQVMRHLDYTVNIKWVMAHYSAARHYLNSGNTKAQATGGSEWEKYMLPRYQKRIFFPSLWTEAEIATWGLAAEEALEGG